MNCEILKGNPASFQKIISDIPGDKSISHRAAILGSLCEGTTTISQYLMSEDCVNTLHIFKALGVPIDINTRDQSVQIEGVGLSGLKKPSHSLDVGNSGTGIRLITGVLAAQPFSSEITGDASIQKRPMKRIVAPLTAMGADIKGISASQNTTPPLCILPANKLLGITYDMPIASAQVKSCVLLAALWASGETKLIQPALSRDHTERMLRFFGVEVKESGLTLSIKGGQTLMAPSSSLTIPSDISSAAFLIVLALCAQSGYLTLTGINVNPTRDRFLQVLIKMGGKITISNERNVMSEPVADITVTSSDLQNTHISEEDVPFLIDEIPILSVAALFAKGVFKVTGASELRVKESDRIQSIVDMVSEMGGKVVAYDDGFEIEGPVKINKFRYGSGGDHRMAMSAVIAAVASNTPATVENCDCIATSFPQFFVILQRLTDRINVL
ncbi:MAG: 3-phosphoshikimate 1-carboxyvinyltransferase [Candidatus Margulisbacteria bacterium]|nr:3-phosphoshikimate 1-carboxyvinyltransferase [Candidatus Margulisiibacteriota bacterium]